MVLIHDPYFGYQWNELTIMQSGNVPTMYIDVRSGKMDHIHADNAIHACLAEKDKNHRNQYLTSFFHENLYISFSFLPLLFEPSHSAVSIHRASAPQYAVIKPNFGMVQTMATAISC